MNKRLLFIAPSAYTLGGLATWLDYLLPGLEVRGWDVRLGLVAGRRHHDAERYLASHPYAGTIPLVCMTGTAAGRIRALRRGLRVLCPNIVLTVNIPDGLIAAAAERDQSGTNVRAVMTCHGIQPDLFEDMRLLQHSVDAVVCTNRLACRLAADRGGIEAERIFHASYGTELSRSSRLYGPPNVLTIAYVGRLEQPQKRVHDLIPMIADLADKKVDFRLIIAGDGPEEASLRSAVRKSGLSSRVEFLGRVSPNELPEVVYRRADVVVVPSRWETGPIVIWEAMAHEAVVVSSRYVGSGREGALVHDQNCLLFDVGDMGSAAQQLARLDADRRLLNRLACAGRRTVQAHYSHSASIDRWDAVLRDILAAAPRRDGQMPSTGCQRSGRLDAWLPTAMAEAVRRWLARPTPDSGPGGEWPHTLSGAAYDEEAFWERAAALDRPISEPAALGRDGDTVTA